MSAYNFKCSLYQELTVDELYEIMVIRQEVFVVEQNCPYLDADGLDKEGFHLMIRRYGRLLAYSRIFPKETKYQDYASLTRIVVGKQNRREGLGKILVQKSLEWVYTNFGNVPVKISAQVYLIQFYQGFGFKITSKEYLEDGIPHIEMVKPHR